MIRILIVVFSFLLFGNCREDREPKFFFGQKPQTVITYRKVPEVVTEFIPSSCIVIEPTLPPCRHVRNLEIYPSVPTRITRTKIPQSQNAQSVEIHNWKPVRGSEIVSHTPTPPLNVRPQRVKNPSQPWNWNIFNIFRTQNVTFTATKTEFITTKVEDPNTVVSFYVKGCRPSKLPFNLPECVKPEEITEKNKNLIIMAPLKFVSNVDAVITPSRIANVSKVEEVAQTPQENTSETDSLNENNDNKDTSNN